MISKLGTPVFLGLSLIFLFAPPLLAQTNTFPSSGRVGIGTTAPDSQLSIRNGGISLDDGGMPFKLWSGVGGINNHLRIGTDIGHYGDAVIELYQNYSGGGAQNPGKLIVNGSIGIGTTSPDSKLHIFIPNGIASYPTHTTKGDVVQSIRSNNNGFEIGNSRGFNDRKAWILARHSSVEPYGKYYSALHLQPDVGDKSQYRGVGIGFSASENIPRGTHLAVNGKVGVGTLNPDSELTVKGNIHAEEVKVDLSIPGPDYVFKEDYDLKPLEEVRNYIKKNGHLPNIPSAKDMEENGIQLGEMNMKLLEKIEELTLYILELKTEQKALKRDNDALKLLIEQIDKK